MSNEIKARINQYSPVEYSEDAGNAAGNNNVNSPKLLSDIETVDDAQKLIGDVGDVGEVSFSDGQLVLTKKYSDGSLKTTTFSSDAVILRDGTIEGSYTYTTDLSDEALASGMVSVSGEFEGRVHLKSGKSMGTSTTIVEFGPTSDSAARTETTTQDGRTVVINDTVCFTGGHTFEIEHADGTEPYGESFRGSIRDGVYHMGHLVTDNGTDVSRVNIYNYIHQVGGKAQENGYDSSPTQFDSGTTQNETGAIQNETGAIQNETSTTFNDTGTTYNDTGAIQNETSTTPNDTISSDFDEIEAEKLKADENYRLNFNHRGNDYYVKFNKDSNEFEAYKIVTGGDDILIDKDVQINSKNTVDGFIEVRGVAGLKAGDALYIGHEPGSRSGGIKYIEATHDLNNIPKDANLEASNLERLLALEIDLYDEY